MKKFVNHIDHVVWISKPETLDKNVATLEKLSGAKMERFSRSDMGFTMCLSWEAGLEMVAPLPEVTAFNQALHHRLATQGEGILGVVFGIKDLEKHKARIEKLGYTPGPLMDDHADSPWHHKLNLSERIAGEFLGGWFILGDIDYADGVIPFGDA